MASGYGHVSSEQGGNNSGRNKKIATIGVSSLILVAMVVAVAVGVNHGKGGAHAPPADPAGGIQTSAKSVDAFCAKTDYQQACKDSVANAGNSSSTLDLIKAAFDSTLKQMSDAIANSSTIKELAKDPLSKHALDNCKELVQYSIDDLKRSFEQIGEPDLTRVDDMLNDLQIWISASVTYQETCLDGFQNTTGDAGDRMRKALNTSMALTSNALAFVTEVNDFLGDSLKILNHRQLEEEVLPKGTPSWVHARRGLLATPSRTQFTPDVTVAQDGTGKYKTINEALKDVPMNNKKQFIIYVKEGVYKEQVFITGKMNNVMVIGDGPTKTKVTGSKCFANGDGTTSQTYTFAAKGDGFMARDIGFENTAGSVGHQAVALMIDSDMSIIYNCQIDGYQDTLYTRSKRQFYRDCTITGTIDFVFGDGQAILQNCKLVARKPMVNQQNAVTAQGRTDKRGRGAIILQGCTITADPLLEAAKANFKSFLGRPWKEYSRTIIMYTEIGDFIQPEGWSPWMGTFALDTCFYAEIENKGPGADTSKRVKWKCIQKIDAAQATAYTAPQFYEGDAWIKSTGLPYAAGLTV